jgi:4-hydroxybenzoate polyprenyltransferase
MLKRLHIYFKERYPIFPRLLLGLIVFFEIYFIVLLNYGVTGFDIGAAEFVGAFTVFSFLCFLRIADDFKDIETDKRLFPERPLPSGRTFMKDLAITLSLLTALTIALNILFMNNLLFFLILYAYGALMSVWFFQRTKIQKSLPLALVTHNPVQMIMNIYIISFTCIKYGLSPFTLTTVMAAFTLYFPALIWEVSRKIRAPEQENDYVTYSSIFGHIKSTRFVLILTLADIATNIVLVWSLNKISVVLLIANVAWMTISFVRFVRRPQRFVLVKRVELYTYVQEGIMMLTVGAFLIFGKIG